MNKSSTKNISSGVVLGKKYDAIIALGGDILIRDNLADIIADKPVDFLFNEIAHELSQCDLVYANLETPISSFNAPNPEKDPTLPFLGISPKTSESLTSGLFHLFQIANNHILDFGQEGLFETMQTLDDKKVGHVGAGKNELDARTPWIKEINGCRIGFLAYSNTYYADVDKPGCAPLRNDVVIKDIQALRLKVDLVIVGLHHGIVYCDYPLPEHMEMTRDFIDQGADIVVGHHPHVMQGIEYYKSGIIAHSLNSIILDWTEEEEKKELSECTLAQEGIFIYSKDDLRPREGVMLFLGVKGDNITVELKPIYQPFSQPPAFAKGEKKTLILSRLDKISKEMQDPKNPIFGRLEKLHSLENIAGIREDGLWQTLMKLHRIRPRHLVYLKNYVFARIGIH